MTEAVQIELIHAIPTTLTAFAATAGAYFSYRAVVHAKEAVVQARQTEQNTNHMKDELVEEVRKSSLALGKKQEQEKHENREADYQAGRTDQKEGN